VPQHAEGMQYRAKKYKGDKQGGRVVVWTILTLSAALGIVGLVGLLHECWTSARASEISYDNEAPNQQLHHEPQSTYNLLLHKDLSSTGSCGQQGDRAVAGVSAK